jgi:hypothetical protein
MSDGTKEAVRAALLDDLADSLARIHAEAQASKQRPPTDSPAPATSAAVAASTDVGSIVFDLARLHYRTLDQVVTFCLQKAEPLLAPLRRAAEPRPAPAEPDDELSSLLRSAQVILLKYPVAAQAAFRAFVNEGRRFAETPEGQRWKSELAGSELIRRGRVVWEVGTLNILEEHAETAIPSKVVDAVVQATAVRALEPLLSRLFEQRGPRGS